MCKCKDICIKRTGLSRKPTIQWLRPAGWPNMEGWGPRGLICWTPGNMGGGSGNEPNEFCKGRQALKMNTVCIPWGTSSWSIYLITPWEKTCSTFIYWILQCFDEQIWRDSDIYQSLKGKESSFLFGFSFGLALRTVNQQTVRQLHLTHSQTLKNKKNSKWDGNMDEEVH